MKHQSYKCGTCLAKKDCDRPLGQRPVHSMALVLPSFAQAWPELGPERRAMLQEGQLRSLDKLRALFMKQTAAFESVCQVQPPGHTLQ